MKKFQSNCLAVLAMVALLLPLAWIFGFTPDGILAGQWPRIDDHPTNWYDTTAQPEGR